MRAYFRLRLIGVGASRLSLVEDFVALMEGECEGASGFDTLARPERPLIEVIGGADVLALAEVIALVLGFMSTVPYQPF